jgi:hypothetical protein
MNRVHPRSFGFALAVFLGAGHALWAFLVWAGAAQWLLDFIFRLHMIAPPYRVTAFSPITATGLVLTTAAIGYLSGWFIGFVWNQFVARPANWQLEQHEPKHAH